MASLREIHRDALRPLLLDALHASNLRVWVAGYLTVAGRRLDNKQKNIEILMLEDYLLDHSNLALEGANRDLLAGFADAVQSVCQDETLSLRVTYNSVAWLMEGWRFLLDGSLSQQDALLILPACSAVGTGVHAAIFHAVEDGTRVLMHLAANPLDAVRKAVIFGFQRMLLEDWRRALYELRRYVLIGDSLQHAIAAAAVADPGLVAARDKALDALDLHHGILSAFRRLPPQARRQEWGLALQQMLPQAISSLITAIPETGLAVVQVWLTWRDPDIEAIVRAGLNSPALRARPEVERLLRGTLFGAP